MQQNNFPVNCKVHEYFSSSIATPKMRTNCSTAPCSRRSSLNSATPTSLLALFSRITNFVRANKSSNSSVCWAVEWIQIKFGKDVFISGRLWAIFIVLAVPSSTKTGTKLDELSFVVRLGRRMRTVEDYPSRRILFLWYKNGQWHERGNFNA